MSRRHEIIEMLIEDDFRSEKEVGGFFYQIMLNGFQGYESFTDDQLAAEMTERGLWNEWFKEPV
ncbi:MAG: hypothetical protein EB023_08385 [Flavobacteriia bacterium]|nr:hypothetical protein [Flavobacteriia bacterium]